MTRYVAIDLETTSLDTHTAYPLEIAAVELTAADDDRDYGDVMNFVPHHRPEVLHAADPEALAVNRYYERRLFDQRLTTADTDRFRSELIEMLTGATLVGANVAYDAAVLWRWLRLHRDAPASPPWHHRLWDVELATAVLFGLDRIPSLSDCVERVGHHQPPETKHTALGDAYAAADLFYELRDAPRGGITAIAGVGRQ